MSKALQVRELTTGAAALSVSDDFIVIDSNLISSVKLPDPAKVKGKVIYIALKPALLKKVTVLPFGSELIKGTASFTLSLPESIRFISDGLNWY